MLFYRSWGESCCVLAFQIWKHTDMHARLYPAYRHAQAYNPHPHQQARAVYCVHPTRDHTLGDIYHPLQLPCNSLSALFPPNLLLVHESIRACSSGYFGSDHDSSYIYPIELVHNHLNNSWFMFWYASHNSFNKKPLPPPLPKGGYLIENRQWIRNSQKCER